MIARERLLDIAESMMSRRGYAGTSVAEIVGAAGVGPPTLYWHFANKRGVLAAVMERGAERWLGALPSWDDVPGRTPRERFVKAMSAGSRALLDNPQFLRLLLLLSLERSEHDEAVLSAIRSIRVRARAFVIGLLRSAWPALSVATAEDLAFKVMAFADGFCVGRMVEPERYDERQHLWLIRAFADQAEALVAARLKAQPSRRVLPRQTRRRTP